MSGVEGELRSTFSTWKPSTILTGFTQSLHKVDLQLAGEPLWSKVPGAENSTFCTLAFKYTVSPFSSQTSVPTKTQSHLLAKIPPIHEAHVIFTFNMAQNETGEILMPRVHQSSPPLNPLSDKADLTPNSDKWLAFSHLANLEGIHFTRKLQQPQREISAEFSILVSVPDSVTTSNPIILHVDTFLKTAAWSYRSQLRYGKSLKSLQIAAGILNDERGRDFTIITCEEYIVPIPPGMCSTMLEEIRSMVNHVL